MISEITIAARRLDGPRSSRWAPRPVAHKTIAAPKQIHRLHIAWAYYRRSLTAQRRVSSWKPLPLFPQLEIGPTAGRVRRDPVLESTLASGGRFLNAVCV